MSGIIVLRPSTGGKRRFALTDMKPVVGCDYHSADLPSQSNQTWDLRIYQRIEDRGYVCILIGGGQWSNRGDHGDYIGLGKSAEDALQHAWDQCQDQGQEVPNDLMAPARDYDNETIPPPVE